jgi:CheY-like chemotaxis protein
VTAKDKLHGPILVVEDHDDIRDYLAYLLRRNGYEVRTASDGLQALAALRASELPCLVLLDLLLPTMDGFQFRHEQVRDAGLASIPVVALSSDGSLRSRIMALGVAEFLEKPVLQEKLLETIDRFC